MLKPRSHTCALIVAAACAALCLHAHAAVHASVHARLAAPTFDAKTLKRAARLVERLRRLDAAAASSDSRSSLRNVAREFYPELHFETSALPEGDLKTELSTAAFDYEESLDVSSQTPSTGALPHAAQLLNARARRRVVRAEALLRYAAGDRSEATMTALSELRSERARDLALVARALTALKSLDAEVKLHSSRARLEDEGGAVARVPFERMAEDFRRVEATVRDVLETLPRSPVYYHLRHALNSYRDGLFWWHHTRRRTQLVVRADELSAPDPLAALGIETEVVNYTVVGNWKSARRHILKAEAEMLKARALPAQAS